jgi:triphosphatase
MVHSDEIELKLEVSASQIGRLDRLPLLKGVKPNKSSTLRSVYFDTAKRKLRRRGLSLRVRRQDGRHVQTVKQQRGRSAGLFERDEWNAISTAGSPISTPPAALAWRLCSARSCVTN